MSRRCKDVKGVIGFVVLIPGTHEVTFVDIYDDGMDFL